MEPLSIIVTLASGIIIGWWGHTLSSKRDREAREHAAKIDRDKRLSDYEAFLLEWEQRIERTEADDLTNIYFREGAALFRSRAAQVRRDFPDRAEFKRLDDALARLTPSQLRDRPPHTSRHILADAIRPLIQHVQAA
jgi:hypothetical protein